MKKSKPRLEIDDDVDRFTNVKKRKPRLESDVDFIKVKRGRPSQAQKMHSHEANENLGHPLSAEDVEDDNELVSRHVTHGFHLVRGKMDHGMEDYIVAENRKVNGHELGLYAIFDGHSGRDVAEYLQNHLFDNILSEPDFWTNPKKAIKRAYKATDNDILEMMIGSRGGSTAVTAILIDQEKLIIANVGDSRAILCRNGQAKRISVDHEPQKEKELVEGRGGFVSKSPGNVPRVDGQLAMTRAFGDAGVKEHITSEPYVRVESIDKDIEFIILASDGLWKVMSNQEALDCIKKIDDAQQASEKLIREALSRKSYDDISCVVVIFH
ncbi:probable protein phosphatase 2C 58 isoform X2 [Ziziphus jujuba]|uniref:Probable protein phosphatase 2C 58 isoform X2 n=1 Tax=Ziziphus jujuba TaxID=326968 RepID=A0ABM3I4Z4_ZIZJJ|nr:probable protein phosphatase 2C 58 isoform X2 [Ziziphus jujuba]